MAGFRRTVQLRHHLPDGSDHVDWMLARDEPPESPLVTFRLARRVDELAPADHLPAERLPDHRTRYLTYEGPISGDRGCVSRITSGSIRAWIEVDGGWELELEWDRRNASERQRLRIESPTGRRATIVGLAVEA
jgi:hypothetical protein